ncbi:MAG: ATP-binding cassette domain-containing protein [Treponema sp.]|nr:ATP-binding cassette domain-containing protein [Treponema sp.]
MSAFISIKHCRVQDLRRTYIPEISWQMNAGEAWLVIGANNSGKDMFLRALAGEKDFVANAISSDRQFCSVFAGSTEIVSLERAAALIEEERDLDETDYMNRLDEGRTGRRFIAEVLGGPDAKHRNLPLPPIASRLETMPEVKLCGVEGILERGLKYMSTGEIRRTLLCRALLSKKKLLILSDPFAGLDVQSRQILREFFQTIVGRQLRAGADDDTTRIILAMERYTEIPETITHVLEFANNAVSFCGIRADYEKLLSERENEKQKHRSEEKSALADAFNQITEDAALLISDDYADRVIKEQTLIQLNHVNVGWDGRLVLRDLNWSVLPNQHWLIRGPNGSGKTTLLELITGDNKQVYANDVWLFGHKRGTGETIWDIKQNLGIVSYRLHVEYRMVGGTDLLRVIVSGFHDSIGLYQPPTDIEIAAAKKWLSLAGFSGRENESFSSLSYGEQRAILIIRAAVKQPKVLILDEPCHGLDENYRQKILDLLESIAETKTTTLLHVTHDPGEALPCEKHILELRPNEVPMYQILTN